MTNHKKSAKGLGILCPNATTQELLQIVMEKFKPSKAIGKYFTKCHTRENYINYSETSLYEYYIGLINDAAKTARKYQGAPAYLFSLEQVKDLLQIEPQALVIYDEKNDCFVVPPSRKKEERKNARIPMFA